MKIVNVNAIAENERKSPRGKFQRFAKNISWALGRDQESMDLLKRHPFDFALVRIPPGAALCPYHLHSAQWEMYVIVSGQGNSRDAGGTNEVGAGDAFMYAPGEAHQLINTGQEDLVYYVIADNPIGDSCYYPDSNKYAVDSLKGHIIVRGEEADYFEGEE